MPNFLISPKDIYSAIDDNGNPLSGGQLYTYIAGSNTPADTWTDATGTVKNDNPIILDSRGEARVWLSDEMVYKFVLRQPASEGGAIIRTTDNIQANNGGGGVGISYVAHSDSDTISLDGLGTEPSPLTANLLISSITSNALGITTAGGGGVYVADLSEAISDIETELNNKLDKVDPTAQSVVSEVTLKEGLILGNDKWIRPETSQAPMYLTLGNNPSGNNTTVQMNPNSMLLTAGNGSSQSGFMSFGTNGFIFDDPSGLYKYTSIPNSTPVKSIGLNANDELVQFDATDDGENNTSSNVGTGAGLALPKVGVDLPFKSIKAGANVNILESAEEIEVSASGTTAGLLSKVYFTADLDPVNLTWYQLSDTGKGATASAEQQIALTADSSASFTEKYISGEYGFIGEVTGGDYEMQLVVQVNNNNGSQRFEAQYDLVDADGISNVVPLATLDSGVINIAQGNPTQIKLTGSLPASVAHTATQRVRVTITAFKVGGSNLTLFSVFSGSDYESYIEIPVAITSDAVTDLSSVNAGGTLTQSLNLLDSNKLDKVDATAQSVVSPVTWNAEQTMQSGLDVTGALSNGMNVSLPSSAFIGNGANPADGSRIEFNTYLALRDSVNNLITSNNATDWEYYANGGSHIFSDNTNVLAQFSRSLTTFDSLAYKFLNVPSGTATLLYGQDASGNLVTTAVGGGSQDLQSVLTEGNISTLGATFGGSVTIGGSNSYAEINMKRSVDVSRKWHFGVSSGGDFDFVESGVASRFKMFAGGNMTFNGLPSFTQRILQGGVTDDGTTGIQGVDASFKGTLGSVVVGQSPSNSDKTGNSIKYTRDGANYLTYGVGGTSGSLRVGATSSLTNVLFTRDLTSRFYGDVVLDTVPTGTQVGLVGYDANGKLIQGTGGGGGGLKYYPTFNVANITAGSALSGSYFAVKFIPTADIQVTKFEYYVTSASAGKTVYCGIYNEAGDTLLGEANGNADSTGLIETSAVTAFTLTGGEVYWISILEGSGTPNFGTKTQFADSNLARSAFVSGTPTGMPTSITTGTATTTSAYIGVKA